MYSIRDFIDPGGRLLARRVDQLCSTLEGLGARLRGTVANAIGETIGAFVRDTALRVLDEISHDGPSSSSNRPRPQQWPRNNDRFDRGEHDQRNYWSDDDEPERDFDDPPALAAPERLPTALSAGLQAASLWLRRWSGQTRLVTTLSIGCVAAGIAYVGGPLAIIILNLAGLATPFSAGSDASSDARFHSYDSA